MNILKRCMAMLMVLCMLITVAPMNVSASTMNNDSSNSTKSTTNFASATESSDFLKIFHLDCGRKYFTIDQVKELIDAISAVGYSHMELAIGNDGLRLLLDDMSIEANGTVYDSNTIKNAIKSGNTKYSHSGEWSETEMNEIISYGKKKGIEIIPLVNNPGHMDSILAAMSACGINGYYKTSSRTVDLENAKAVAFTQAFVMKYAEYFASKGCNYFNIGADEYANDYHTSDSTGMGFGYLIDNKKYGNFITYVNTLVDAICKLDMTPIAFNDGIYFRENTSFGTFDNRLMISSWSGGWGGIKPASTTFLANKGHKILNTNERWYYVLGRSQSSNSTYCYESALSNAKSESATTVTDHKSVTPIGAMQCVWCDVPSVNYETNKSKVMTLINTFASSNPTYFKGPNVVKPETVTMTDEETDIVVSAPGLSDLVINKVEDEVSIPDVAGLNGILVYDVKAFSEGEPYTDEIQISIPVPTGWTRIRGGVLASDAGEEVMDIEGKLENSVFTFTVPHLSRVVVYSSEYDALVELKVDDVHEIVFEGEDLSGTYTPDPEGIVDVNVSYVNTPLKTERALGSTVSMSSNAEYTGLIKSGNYYLVMNENGAITSTTDINRATIFKVTRKSSSYTINNGSKFLAVSNNSLTSSNNSYNWSYSSGFQYTSGWRTYRLVCSNGTWKVATSGTKGNLYSFTDKVTETLKESTVLFKGISAGEAYVTINGVRYKIVVTNIHNYETVRLEATCEKDGSITTTCTICGDTSVEVLPAFGHDYETVRLEATCTTNGGTTHTCAVCGDTYTTDFVAAFGHKYETVTVEPTCTERGTVTHTCVTCGQTTIEVLEALGHDYKTVTVEATCEKDGSITTTCNNCGETDTEVIKALGHNYKTVTIEATCEKDGSITTSCENCGDRSVEVLKAFGHSYTSEESGNNIVYTCGHCGHSYTESLAVEYSYDKVTAFKSGENFVITLYSNKKYYAVTHTNNKLGVTQVTVSGNQITSEVTEDMLWTYNNNKLSYKDGATTHYMYVSSSGGWFGFGATITLSVSTTNSSTVSFSSNRIKVGSYYLRYSSGTVKANSSSTTAYVYMQNEK